MAIKKSVKMAQDPMDELDSGMSPQEAVNADFEEDPNAPKETYQEDPDVIKSTNNIRQNAWKMKVALHQSEFDKEWSKMSAKKQEQYMADLRKQYDTKMARTRKVQPAQPSMQAPQAVADDSTQGL